MHSSATPSSCSLRGEVLGVCGAASAAARDRFTGLGLGRLAGRCTELLKDASPNPWAGEGVTDREADVLRLVIAGLANKEIAAALRLSPRTVEKHVENLLRKTGARSRLELAVTSRHPAT